MKLWITQYWNGEEWRNSLFKKSFEWNTTGRDVLVVHESEEAANESLRIAIEGHRIWAADKTFRVVHIYLPSD